MTMTNARKQLQQLLKYLVSQKEEKNQTEHPKLQKGRGNTNQVKLTMRGKSNPLF